MCSTRVYNSLTHYKTAISLKKGWVLQFVSGSGLYSSFRYSDFGFRCTCGTYTDIRVHHNYYKFFPTWSLLAGAGESDYLEHCGVFPPFSTALWASRRNHSGRSLGTAFVLVSSHSYSHHTRVHRLQLVRVAHCTHCTIAHSIARVSAACAHQPRDRRFSGIGSELSS